MGRHAFLSEGGWGLVLAACAVRCHWHGDGIRGGTLSSFVVLGTWLL